MDYLQLALMQFNTDIPNWYKWIDTSNGMVYSNVELNDDTAVMPSEEEVNQKIAQLQWEDDRKNNYPSIADQLDDIFHNGLDGWKATIQETKDKYPKPV
jgi:hypothetical protein